MNKDRSPNLKMTRPTKATTTASSKTSKIDVGNSIIQNKDQVVTTTTKSLNTTVQMDLEQCDLCSAQYELPHRLYAQPDLNRLICKVLHIEPHEIPDGLNYFSQYVAFCSACALSVRRFDKLRIELEILRQEIVTSVLDTIVYIRPNHTSPIHRFKQHILDKWQFNQDGNFERNQSQNASSPITNQPKKSSVTSSLIAQDKPKPFITTSAAVASIDSSNESHVGVEIETAGNSWVTSGTTHYIAEPGENGEPWKVCEVNVYSGGEGDPSSQIITNYVNEVILVDHGYTHEEEQNLEGQDDNDNADDDEIPSIDAESIDIREVGDPDSNSDSVSDYFPSEDLRQPKSSKRKQVLKTRSDPKVTTIDIRGLLDEYNYNPPRKKKTMKVKLMPYCEIVPQQPPYVCLATAQGCGCGRLFSKWKTLRCHIQKKLCKGEKEMTPKNCGICSEDFSNSGWRALKFHIDEKHVNAELEKCRFCRKEFLSNAFSDHPCIHPNEKTKRKEYHCDYCIKFFYTSNVLSEHIRRLHPASFVRNFKCDICKKSFVSNAIHVNHMGTHNTSGTQFACGTCGICTTTSWGLKEHMRVHTGEKPHICKVCGKSFRLLTILKNHMVIHTKEKNFSCDICGREFALYGTMLRHWKLHNTPTPKRGEGCPICKSECILFRKTKNLKRHMRIKHPGTTEQLEICARELDAEELEDQGKYFMKSGRLKVLNSRKISENKSRASKQSRDRDSESDRSIEDVFADNESESHLEEVEEGSRRKVIKIQIKETPRTTTMSTRHGGKRIVNATKRY